MDWSIILAWIFAWGLYLPGFMYGQMLLIARYSWKETGDPGAYFKDKKTSAVKALWSRHRVLWTFYFASLLAAIAAIVSGSLVTLAVLRYMSWPIGIAAAMAIEGTVYATRGSLYRMLLGRITAESLQKADERGLLVPSTWVLFAMPAFYLIAAAI